MKGQGRTKRTLYATSREGRPFHGGIGEKLVVKRRNVGIIDILIRHLVNARQVALPTVGGVQINSGADLIQLLVSNEGCDVSDYLIFGPMLECLGFFMKL